MNQLDRLEALVRTGTWHQPELHEAADILPDLIRVARANEEVADRIESVLPQWGITAQGVLRTWITMLRTPASSLYREVES